MRIILVMKGDESTQETEEGHKVNKWWQKQKMA